MAGAPETTLETPQTQALGRKVLPLWLRGVPPPGPKVARQWWELYATSLHERKGLRPKAQPQAVGSKPRPLLRAAHPWSVEMELFLPCPCSPTISYSAVTTTCPRRNSVSAYTDDSRMTPSLPCCVRACLSPRLTRHTLPSSESPASALAATSVSEG